MKINMKRFKDVELHNLLQREADRQNIGINLIASENYASQEIMDIAGSIFCNKYGVEINDVIRRPQN